DAGHGCVARGRRQRDDRLSTLAARGPANEVDLSADPAVEARADRVGTYLARQIDLQAGVYRDHVVVAGNDERIVRLIDWMQFHSRVVMHELVPPLRTEDETGSNLPRVQRLSRARDDASLHQLDCAVAEHLRVNAEVTVISQKMKHAVGNRTNTELER